MMPRHLTDAQRVDQLLPLRITRRLLETVGTDHADRPDHVEARDELNIVMYVLTRDMPEKRRDSLLRRLERSAADLLAPFEPHKLPAVAGALVLWFNDLTDRGALDVNYDQPGMRVFADILEAVNEATELATTESLTDRLYRAAVRQADHLAPLLAARAQEMGLYQRQVRR